MYLTCPFNTFDCQSYVVESSKDGVPATGGDTSYSGRELGQFVNTWKVLTSNPWVLQTVKGFRIPFTSLPSQTTQPAELVFPSEQAAQVREELQSLLVKGAVVPVIGCHKGFYSTQEEWPDETRNQSEAVERVGDYRALQDEGNLHPEGPVEVGGLVCEDGSERRLLHSSHRDQSSAIPEIYARGEELPIHLPSLWPILCPPHLHQSTEASNDPSQVLGSQDNLLYKAEKPSVRLSASRDNLSGFSMDRLGT